MAFFQNYTKTMGRPSEMSGETEGLAKAGRSLRTDVSLEMG
jgi:hypothetical protein